MAKFCGKCGTPLDEETGLCPKCDEEKLIALQQEKQVVYKKRFCTRCGSNLDANGLCPNCDKDKIAASNQDDEEKVVVNKQRFCNKCGSTLDEETGLCPKCDSKKLEKLQDRVEDETEEEEESKNPKVLKIIGIVIGSLALIAIVAIAIYFLLNNVINKDDNDTTSDNEVVEVADEQEETSTDGLTIYTYDYTLEVGEYVAIDMDDNGNGYSIVSNDFSVVSYKNDQLYGEGAGKTTVTLTCGGVEYTLNVTVEGDEDSDEYILANSSTELLTESDVENLSSDELRLARNEIYARHGCYFEDEELQEYFESCSWYENKNLKALDYYDSLSDIEKENIKLIQSYE